MPRRSRRELETELEELEDATTDDVPPLGELCLRSAKRAEGEIDDPLPEDEFAELWRRSYQQQVNGGTA